MGDLGSVILPDFLGPAKLCLEMFNCFNCKEFFWQKKILESRTATFLKMVLLDDDKALLQEKVVRKTNL